MRVMKKPRMKKYLYQDELVTARARGYVEMCCLATKVLRLQVFSQPLARIPTTLENSVAEQAFQRSSRTASFVGLVRVESVVDANSNQRIHAQTHTHLHTLPSHTGSQIMAFFSFQPRFHRTETDDVL